MKVKSFTCERNWTGKYYRQRLLPSMQTMDKHIASMLSDGWKIMTEKSHSGNSRGFRPFRNTIPSQFRFENLSNCRVAIDTRPGSNKGHVSCNLQYSCGLVGCHLRRKVVEFAVSHETHNPKVGGSNPPPATKPFIELRASDVFTAGAKKGNKQASAVKCDKRSCFGSSFHFASLASCLSAI